MLIAIFILLIIVILLEIYKSKMENKNDTLLVFSYFDMLKTDIIISIQAVLYVISIILFIIYLFK